MSSTELFTLLEVETTNTCNRRCWHCLHGQQRRPPTRQMSWGLIEKIIDELKRIAYSGTLNWFSINEPLMDKRIFDIIRRSSSDIPTCKVQIYSNGDLLTQEALDRLFSCGLWRLRISLYDEETDAKIRHLDTRGHDVQIRRYYGSSDDFAITNRERIQYNSRSGMIRQLVQLGDEKYLNYNCPRPFHKMALRYDGKLKLCAEDQTGRTFDDSMSLETKTLKQLWFSPEMEHYRQLLGEGRRSELATCRDCNYHRDCEKVK